MKRLNWLVGSLKHLLEGRLRGNSIETYKIINDFLSYGHMVSCHSMFTKETICSKHYLEIQIDLELRYSSRIARRGQCIKERDGQFFILSHAFVSIVKPQFNSSSSKLVSFNFLIGAS